MPNDIQYPKCSGSSAWESYQMDLIKLADLTGISVKPQILSILIELLGMNVHPNSLHALLKDICSRHVKERPSRTDSRAKSKRPSEKRTDTKSKT